MQINKPAIVNWRGSMQHIPEGKDEVIAVAKEICCKHPRRPAMIEELSRVIKMQS